MPPSAKSVFDKIIANQPINAWRSMKKGAKANRADSDQTPQNAATDLSLPCLHKINRELVTKSALNHIDLGKNIQPVLIFISTYFTQINMIISIHTGCILLPKSILFKPYALTKPKYTRQQKIYFNTYFL